MRGNAGPINKVVGLIALLYICSGFGYKYQSKIG